jgi:capsular exopolysaccharide synthesis family protein
MSVNYIPSNLPVEPGRDADALGFPQAWPAAAWAQPAAEESGVPWARYFAALRRYKWLILLIVVLGTAAGFGATRLMAPEYQVQGTIWISDDSRRQNAGPVRGDELLGSGAWADLLTSPTIMERVVKRMALYRWATNPADTAVLAGLQPGPGFHPGTYELRVDASGKTYSLATKDGNVVETGTVGDSVGRSVGLHWAPPASELHPDRVIEFSVRDPRQVAMGLMRGIDVNLPQGSSFLKLTLTGVNPRQTAGILNATMSEFVATAGDLKRRNLIGISQTLRSQLDSAREGLKRSEAALQSFRTATITLPSEPMAPAIMPGGAPGGVESPVVTGYFGQKLQLEALQHDRAALQALLSNPEGITADAFMPIPIAQQAPDLQAAMTELSKRETALRAAREIYTDQHPTVVQLRASVQNMRTQTIPAILRSLISQIDKREKDLDTQLASASAQLKAIPQRSIDQMRLQRDVANKANIYSMLQSRYEEARLAEASAIPDISILDTAVAPLAPTKNTAPNIIVFALVASLGGAVGLALLLDHTDTRFRYPEQASDDLGLTILGAVPTIKRIQGGNPDPVEAAQVIEAFRTIRMGITNACDSTGPIMLTISSPGVGDGKSLVSSNLALSFAEAGYRTVLVDGDTRRGQLHAMFGAIRRPGLLDYLGGDAPLDAVLRPSTHEKLTLVPCGTRRHRGPELLHSQAMLQFMSELRARFDVILVDSPPLGAGVDPFVLGAATGNILIVLRTGATDRKMAEAKLALMQRLPIRPIGAVLNDIRAQGVYRYYTYLYGYSTSEDDDPPQLAPQRGEVTSQT